MPRIALAWSKAPKPGSIAAQVAECLAALGAHVREHRPHDEREAWPGWLRSCDLVVHRGVRPELLRLARADPATSELPWCNPLAATLDVSDRWTLQTRLTHAGVATPSAWRHDAWSDVLERHRAPCVVKQVDGRVGRAAHVIVQRNGQLPEMPPFDGPYLVQALVPGDGLDHTLYVAGDRVFLALKRVDTESRRSELVAVAVPDARMRDLALRVGEATGLELFNLDAIHAPDGMVVVDVNPFPGFRGIHGAAEAIASHVLRRATAVAANRMDAGR